MRATLQLCVAFALMLGASTANASTPEQEAINQAKARVSYNMKDPDSAKFRNVRAAQRGKNIMVCGEINAKNSYGAYAGFKPFLVWGESFLLPDTIDSFSNEALQSAAVASCNSLDKANPPPTRDEAEATQ